MRLPDHATLSRRHVLAGGLTALIMPSLTRPAAAAPIPADGETRFAAFRNGSRFGSHVLTFRQEGSDLHLNVAIDFSVGVGPIKLFRYTHRNEEVWRDGRLLSLDSTTDDDGDEYWVKARADGDVLRVDGSAGQLELPGDTLSTSYWHERTVSRGQWLDSQKGQLVKSTVSDKGAEEVSAGGELIQATRYGLVGDITCDLWYRDGRWVKLLFDIEGSEIEYRLESPPKAEG